MSHRDYYEKGAVTMVSMFDNRVEISNPGGLLPAVAANFGHKSLSRNPAIFGLFTRMNQVEQVGSGIFRMQKIMKAAGKPEPIIVKEGFYSITFLRTNDTLNPNDTLNDTLNDLIIRL